MTTTRPGALLGVAQDNEDHGTAVESRYTSGGRASRRHGTLIVWALIIAAARAWGRVGDGADRALHVHAAPLVGTWLPRWSWGIAAPILAGPILVVGLSWAIRHLRFRLAALVGWVVSLGWALSLTLIDGPDAWWRPMASTYEYLRVVPEIRTDPLGFVRHFLDRYEQFPIHVQGHPPGMPLVLWVLDRLGLGGPRWAAAMVLGAGAFTTVFVADTVRRLHSDAAARTVLVVVAFAPFALWWATSTDALFMAVVAAAVWASTVAATSPSLPWALTAGVVGGVAFMVTYGAAPATLLMIIPFLARRRFASVLVWSAGLSSVMVAAAVGGFSWPAGLARTRLAYASNPVGARSYRYFVFANVAVVAIAIGPLVFQAVTAAVVGSVAVLQRAPQDGAPDGLVLLFAAVIGALIVSDLSGLTRGEAERVWLPFMPWLCTATVIGSVPGKRRPTSSFSTVQMIWTLIIGVWLRTPW